MSRKKSKRKSNDHLLRAKKLVKGLIVKWEDVEPLVASDDLEFGEINHRNALSRPTARVMFKKYGEWICFKHAFKWEITITCIFEHDNEKDLHDTRVLTALGTISQMSMTCEDSIKEMFDAERAEHGSMDRYKTTQYSCECIGYS